MDFKELVKIDAEEALGLELENLKTTIPVDLKVAAEEYKKTHEDFLGFQKLFAKFLSSTDIGIDWDRIEKLPSDSVNTKITTQFTIYNVNGIVESNGCNDLREFFQTFDLSGTVSWRIGICEDIF